MSEHADAQAPMMARFFEFYEGLPRGGPGDPVSTRRALALIPSLPPVPRILDVGCGPGPEAMDLATATSGTIVAVDLHAPFVNRLRRTADRAGLAHRLLPACADMRNLPFRPGSFDLAWAEGSLYSIGFRDGLAACRAMLRPGGYLAASEAVWTVPNPPSEIRTWWDAEYGDMASIEAKAEAVRTTGFTIVGHFTLPRDSWAVHYYEPMRTRLAPMRARWADDEAGLAVIRMIETEIAMHDRFGDSYSYEFFVARR